MRNQAMKSWHSAEQWMLGSMVPASIAVVCIWLPLGPMPTAFAYLTAIAILIALLLASLTMTRLVGSTRGQLAAARPRQPMIRTHQHDPRQIPVIVKDCGVGGAANNADRLFDAFFTTRSGGMGTGPSICRSIIDAHGGRLSVGPGATFQFALPLRQKDGSP
jgi:C4-dicarboxylate-specific signal transduction histidine kinase